MTKQQTKLCEIMREFHTLCAEQHIDYFLIGAQLFHAAKNGKIHGYEMDVAMFLEDWKRIREIGEGLDHIEIETPEDLGMLPACYFRWVDKNTLLLDLDRIHVLKKPGIGINIHIIRKTPYDPYLFLYEKEMRRLAWEKSKLPQSLIPGSLRRASRMAVRTMERAAAGRDAGKTMLREQKGVRIKLPGAIWKHKTEVTLETLTLCTMREYEAYLAERYGEKWKKRKESDAYKEDYRCIFSTSLPYAVYMEEAERENLLSDVFIESSKSYARSFKQYEKMRKNEIDGWEKTMFAAGERYRLWKKYMPQKDKILRFLAEEKTDQAELILQDYMIVLEEYLAKKIVICFDAELLDAVKRIYEANRHSGIVQKIEECVLEEDLKPIRKEWENV